MKVIIRNEQLRQRALDVIRDAPEGHEVIIQKHKDKKTLEQLAYVFGVIYPHIIRFVEENGNGDTFTVEEIHKWMKRQILGVDHKEFDGEVIETERELKKSDREEWSKYIDCVIRYCWNRWGLMIPAPEWREEH